MRKEDVPQDGGLNDGLSEISYAVNEDGKYVLVPSLGWEPKTVSNDQAWDIIAEEVTDVVAQVRAGKRSPLAYHMAHNLMNVGLLAKYVRLPRWKVRWHLRPSGFRRLSPELLERYADVFEIPAEQLCHVPDIVETEAYKKQ